MLRQRVPKLLEGLLDFKLVDAAASVPIESGKKVLPFLYTPSHPLLIEKNGKQWKRTRR